MNIFLRRIPANTKHDEISEFVAPALKRGIFRKSAHILNIEILALQDSRAGTVEYHGLVTLDSESAVQSVVKSLQNRRLNGRIVLVRPYYHRSWFNDPRQQQAEVSPEIIEKRKGDRRRGRHLQVVKNVSDRFNSELDFFESINHKQFQLNMLIPAEFVEPVNAYLNEYCGIGSAAGADDVLLEQEGGEVDRSQRFLKLVHYDEQQYCSVQIYLDKKECSGLLESLKVLFVDSGIEYWLLPVIEQGRI
jgi:hypothetical protein